MLQLNFNPKKTTRLFGLENEFKFLKKMISSDKFPKTLMLTGNRGVGKSTMICHLMHYYFDKKNYNVNENIFANESFFLNQFIENLFPNILYLNGSDYRNVRIDDIRKIINDLNRSPIKNDKRFIILDDIDSFNINSLNALLKIIEDPGKNNFFILINNKSNKLLNTIKSRSIEIKIMINNKDRLSISTSLLKYFNQDRIFDENLVSSTPGNFLKFNYIFNNNSLDINEKFLTNFSNILRIYKKEKDIFYKEMLLFFVEYNFQKLKSQGMLDNKKLIEKRLMILQNINDFFLYNLNQNTLLSNLEENYFDD